MESHEAMTIRRLMSSLAVAVLLVTGFGCASAPERNPLPLEVNTAGFSCCDD